MDRPSHSPVKSAGKIKITHISVPLAASTDEMPRSAISEDVSKPNPKRIPRGYIFHGLCIKSCKERDIALLSPSRTEDSPVNQLKHPFENAEEQSPSLNFPCLILIIAAGKTQDLAHLLDQFV